MDQKKVGAFLKTLRKEKDLTQEMLAEALRVSSRTMSRWETGNNMPDISLLVELSAFYQVSIPEIIDGERKREEMDQEVKTTAIKMAEYSKNELKAEKQKLLNALLMLFGVFTIISAFAIFPNESSWGSIYATIGGAILTAGVYFGSKSVLVKRSARIWSAVGCIILLLGLFTVSDYIAVSQFHQVPRFSYEKVYGDHIIEHKTLFYTVLQIDPGTADEQIEITR